MRYSLGVLISPVGAKLGLRRSRIVITELRANISPPAGLFWKDTFIKRITAFVFYTLKKNPAGPSIKATLMSLIRREYGS